MTNYFTVVYRQSTAGNFCSMMRRIRKMFLMAGMLMCFFAIAQQAVTADSTLTLHSQILRQDRLIDIQLPKNYYNPKFAKAAYPVIYVLDGEMNFQLVAALERFDTKFMYRPHPELIVVGIRNIDRTKDFTPTPENPEDGTGKNFRTAGGAEAFLSFIEKELKPFIHRNYRTNGFDILHGHSFGGLFTIYTLVKKAQLFNAYISIDPSLWWDNRRVVRDAQKAFASTDYQKRSLFVAMAQEPEDIWNDKTSHSETIRKFCEEILPLNPEKNLYTYWKYYPEYDHGAVPVASTLDALKKIFDGIELPVKKVPGNPETVLQSYRKLSEKLNFNLKPEESLLYQLILYTQQQKQTENSRILLDYALSLYPESSQLNQLKP